MFSAVLSHIISLLPCPLCRTGTAERPNAICGKCREKLALIADDAECCPGCGGVMNGILGVCSQCLAEPERPWFKAYTLMPFSGYAKEQIHRFKFNNHPEFARPFGHLLAEKLNADGNDYDFLVPIPLHFIRQFTRGYNQSQLLADAVSHLTGIPCRQPLRRKYFRSNQSKRNRTDRHKALAGSFILKSPESIKNRRILLIDDVLTTGATLHAATKTLLHGGAESVSVLTLARTAGLATFS